MFIGVVDGTRRQVQCALCFDGGTVVVDRPRLARSPVAGVQRAADGHVATGKEHGVFAVVDVFCTDVQTVTGGDHRRGCHAIDGFSFVVHGGGSDGDVVTEDAPASQVAQGLGDDHRLLSVNEATIDQRVGISGIELQAIADQRAARTVHDGRSLDPEQRCRLHQPIVGKRAATVDIDAAIAAHRAAVAEASGQFDGRGLLAQYLAITAQCSRINAGGTGIELAAGIGDGEAAAVVDRTVAAGAIGIAVGDAQCAAGRDGAGTVVEAAAGADGGAVIGEDGTARIVDAIGIDADAGGSQALAGAAGVSVGKAGRLDVQGVGGFDQAAIIAHAEAARRGRIHAILNAHTRTARNCAGTVVHGRGGTDGERLLGTQLATAVVDHVCIKREALAEQALRSAARPRIADAGGLYLQCRIGLDLAARIGE